MTESLSVFMVAMSLICTSTFGPPVVKPPQSLIVHRIDLQNVPCTVRQDQLDLVARDNG